MIVEARLYMYNGINLGHERNLKYSYLDAKVESLVCGKIIISGTFQNEKRKMLLEHETLKLKQYDEEYSVAVKDWKHQLKPRKQVL